MPYPLRGDLWYTGLVFMECNGIPAHVLLSHTMAIVGPVVASGYIVLHCHAIGRCRASYAMMVPLYRVRHGDTAGRQGVYCTLFTRV
jgi:hypothetical protein